MVCLVAVFGYGNFEGLVILLFEEVRITTLSPKIEQARINLQQGCSQYQRPEQRSDGQSKGALCASRMALC